MERKLVITIDGPSGAGKSTLSKLLAEKLDYTYIDSGALYRAVALQVQERGADPDDDEALRRLCGNLAISFRREHDRLAVMLDGRDVTDAIRAPEISMLASRVSARKSVRDALLDVQRRLGEGGGIVVEGRDMGTVVFPEAEVKFFLSASESTRALRRFAEIQAKTGASLEEVERDMRRRDEQDSTRALAPLAPAPDAIRIDSTGLGIDQVVDLMAAHIQARLERL